MDLALITQSRNMFIIIVIILTLSINSSYQYTLDIDCINGLNKGINYNGTVSVTSSGTPCSVWGYNNGVNADHNYCRNPDNSAKTWCFIDNPDNPADRNRQYCEIIYCGYLCPDLLFSPNMAQPTNLDKHRIYADVTFKCALGYELSGQRTLTCRYVPGDSMASWNHQQPTCSEIPCPDLRPITNMKQPSNMTGYHYPDSVSFRCGDGYTVLGNTTLKCLPTGQWNGQQPACAVVSCPKLVTKTGQSEPTKLTGYQYSDYVNFLCLRGYTLEGRSSITCEASGHWSNAQPNCKDVMCPTLKKYQHMVAPLRLEGYHFGDNVTFQCANGYELEGPSSVLMCDVDIKNKSVGKWNYIQPSCSESCDHHEQLNGVSYAVYGGTTAAIVVLAITAVIILVLWMRRQVKQKERLYEDIHVDTGKQQRNGNTDESYAELSERSEYWNTDPYRNNTKTVTDTRR